MQLTVDQKYVSDAGDVLTIRDITEAGQIITDVDGERKEFAGREDLKSYMQDFQFEQVGSPTPEDDLDLGLGGDEEEPPMDYDNGEEEPGGMEFDIDVGEPEAGGGKEQQIRGLYDKLLDTEPTGEDAIDHALRDLKGEVSDWLNDNTTFTEMEMVEEILEQDGEDEIDDFLAQVVGRQSEENPDEEEEMLDLDQYNMDTRGDDVGSHTAPDWSE